MDLETRKKISRTMKGHSNFEGHKHTHAEKIAIATSQEGHRNAKDHKWAINRNTGKETRVKGGALPQGDRWGRTKAFSQWIQKESKQTKMQIAVNEFAEFVKKYLELDSLPQIDINEQPNAAKEFKSFGGYYPEEKRIELNTAGRHTMDVLRTLAHELVHYKQGTKEVLPEDAGDTGSSYENEANAIAGVIMREYGQTNSHLFMEDKPSNRLMGTPSLTNTYAKDTPGQKMKKQDDTVPFDKPYKKVPTEVKDKSGAVHTPMSRAHHLARLALQQKKLKEEQGTKCDCCGKMYIGKHKCKEMKEEQVDELKKSTLADYVVGAHNSIVDSSTSNSFKSGAAGDKYNKADETPKEAKRLAGIKRALVKMQKESVSIDELNKTTLSTYASDAALSAARYGNTLGRAQQDGGISGKEIAKHAGTKINARLAGIRRAVRKLQK